MLTSVETDLNIEHMCDLVNLLRDYSNNSHLKERLADLQERVKLMEDQPALRPRLVARSAKLTRRLAESEVEALVAAYESGASSIQLVTDFGIAKGTVLKLLRDRGVGIRNQGLNADAVRDAVERYGTGQSLATIGRAYDVSPMTVRKALLAQGVRMRDPHGRSR